MDYKWIESKVLNAVVHCDDLALCLHRVETWARVRPALHGEISQVPCAYPQTNGDHFLRGTSDFHSRYFNIKLCELRFYLFAISACGDRRYRVFVLFCSGLVSVFAFDLRCD